MKISNLIKTHCILAALVAFSACGNDDNSGPIVEAPSKYVVMTMSDNTLAKPGYVTAFDELPSGDVSNVTTNTLQGQGMGGWRPQQNMLLKMFRTQDNALGIERLNVSTNGVITPGNFISADNSTNGSGNFVIGTDGNGFYWDGADPLKIQKFSAATLSRTGELDLTDVVNERGTNEAGILYRSIGQKFLAIKEGKLYANITYATTNGTQKGFFDDFYPNVYIAVIDVATGNYEKTIEIEDTGSIAYINDNNMYDFDSNGDLYIVCQGRSAVGGKSKIVRIKAGETDVDASWSINMDEIQEGGKFVTVYANEGKLITTIPNTALTGGPTGNINFSEIWEFYSIDVATQARTKIAGVPAVTNPGAAFATVEIDDLVLLRVNAPTQNINGYYSLSGTTATPVFNVTEGGSVSGIYKITLE
ncbi:hypothetical protein [Olivibacter sitiensis]|uniref:hypothetical protein n=1 Tax=Olivibacter sitiensis TaxID=376470 RepID=UPI0004124EEC|nr:hypothetical protein [Olivibacter sitiensis]